MSGSESAVAVQVEGPYPACRSSTLVRDDPLNAGMAQDGAACARTFALRHRRLVGTYREAFPLNIRFVSALTLPPLALPASDAGIAGNNSSMTQQGRLRKALLWETMSF